MRSLASQLARHLPPAARRSDGELLAGFQAGDDADFGELVRRHGPLVWGVCRRALPNAADAEDAFQAVFLVLVRRANRLTGGETLGPWLHRVATWTVKNIRRRNARRYAKQSPLPDQLPAASPDADLPIDLDAALLSLPEKYRSPIVLCHLLGFTRAEAAGKLGCPEGTLSAWLSRGMEKLRVRLRGLDPAKALGVAAVAVPAGLGSAAVRAAVACRVAVASGATSTVSLIAEGVIRMFWVKKATAAATALVAVFAVGVGVGVSGRQVVGVAEGQDKVPAGEKVPGNRYGAPDELAALTADLEAKIETLEALLATAEAGMKATYEKQKAAVNAKAVNAKADEASIKQDKEQFGKFQDTAKKAREQLEALRAERDKLKQAKPDKEQKRPQGGAADKLAQELEQALKARAAALDALAEGQKSLAERAAALKAAGDNPKALAEVKEKLARVREAEADARKELEALKKELAGQKRPAPQPENKLAEKVPVGAGELDKQLSDLKATLMRLEVQRVQLHAEAALRAQELKRLELHVESLREQAESIAKKRAELGTTPVAGKAAAFVELTVSGKGGQTEFTLRETDAAGKVLGTVRVAGPEMLVKLLARTKADASSPKELRVIAEPATAMGAGPTTALKACDAAGYRTVKFTGYIPAGGFTKALDPTQKGDVAGYTRYEGKEASPAGLIREIEEGLKRF